MSSLAAVRPSVEFGDAASGDDVGLLDRRRRWPSTISARATRRSASIRGDLGCDQAKGYVFAYPTPVADLTTSIT
jgi:hypothetical protein